MTTDLKASDINRADIEPPGTEPGAARSAERELPEARSARIGRARENSAASDRMARVSAHRRAAAGRGALMWPRTQVVPCVTPRDEQKRVCSGCCTRTRCSLQRPQC